MAKGVTKHTLGFDPLLSDSVTLCSQQGHQRRSGVCDALSMGYCTAMIQCHFLKEKGSDPGDRFPLFTLPLGCLEWESLMGSQEKNMS